MVTTEQQPGHEDTKPETQRLLTAAEYFLRNRNYADCHNYAGRARDSDPNHPAPIQILSVASVLSVSKISPTQHDYYAILNLPYFDYDAARIRSSFEALASNLDPKSNRFPLSSEAFDLVLSAWSVLSNPIEKAKYDNELTVKLSGGCASGSGGGTFWTICPYCYYVYEYARVFEDCCLRCANERCRRVLHAVAIGGPPPPDMVEKGQYLCPGFAICNSNGNGIGENVWLPFSPATGYADKGYAHNLPSDGDCVVVSDNETVQGEEFMNYGNGGGNNGEKLESGSENSVEKEGMKRRKSVPWNSKKVMGRGIRIDSNEAHFIYGVAEEGHSHLGETLEGSGVEFFEGDGDVFLSLPPGVDLEYGMI